MQTKPAIRSLLRVKLTKRMKEVPGSLVAVGGADIFGPHIDDAKSHLGGTQWWQRWLRAQETNLSGFVRARHVHDMTTFCYSRDFANALYVVSNEENRQLSMGRFWIFPHSILNRSYRDIEDMINDHLDERERCGFQVVTRLGCCMVWARWTRWRTR